LSGYLEVNFQHRKLFSTLHQINHTAMVQADKGARAGNFIIDILVLLVIIVLFTYLIWFVYPDITDTDSAAFDVLASTTFFLYYFLSEFFFGKTVGKILTKTIVLDKNGNKPKTFNLVVRSLVRLIPVESITFLFGLGFHDLVSGTVVVKANSLQSPVNQS
jgi:uncharacterized RDD family membrane protein YckC